MTNQTKLITIVVPVYKTELTVSEKASLLQLFRTLSNYPICLFTFKELDLTAYKAALHEYKYTISYFSKHFFLSITSYNKLLCHPAFYKRFINFKYLLLYQLDAWVFRDELTDWCKAGFDYIGAPWFSGYNNATAASEFLGVGNGGFSLRNIKSHIKALQTFSYIIAPGYLLWTFFRSEKSAASFKNLLLALTIQNNTYYLFNNYNNNEDIFWGTIAGKKFDWFKLPDMETAAMFSMETNASLLYKQAGNKLPFGCHAWEKYEPEFWMEHIPVNKT